MCFILAESRDGGKTWKDKVDEDDTVFATGKEAADKATRLNEYYRECTYTDRHKLYRYRAKRLVLKGDDNFIAREAAKNHNMLPLERFQAMGANTLELFMLPHWHPEEKEKIRFFATLTKAIDGDYTKTNATRFFSNHLGLDVAACEEYLVEVGFYTDKATFEILTDADAIQEAYENGPTSCMNDPGEYPLPDIHPSRVYAGPDLAVAVILRGDKVTARAVIYPAKKAFLRTYGHSTLLKAELKDRGYRSTEARTVWAGARIQKIWDDYEGEFICPYLDMSSTVRESRDGKYLRLAGADGKLRSQCCTGFTCHEDNY